MKTLVCLPTYNEILSINQMIEQIRELGLDLIVSDGHSTDGTVEAALAKGVEVFERDGFGKGSGVKKALAVAEARGYDTLVLIDCDMTYDPQDIPRLLVHMAEFDMVYGHRDYQSIAPDRRLANRLMNLAQNILFFSNIGDMASGLRAFSVPKFIPYVTAEGFDIEPQLVSIALRRKYKIKSVPISYYKREGESKIKPIVFFMLSGGCCVSDSGGDSFAPVGNPNGRFYLPVGVDTLNQHRD